MNASTALSVAGRFREERLRLGRTQSEIAAAAGLSEIAYRRFERSGQITLERLLGIAAALGIGVDLNAVGGLALAPDPRAVRVRRRGLRRPRPTAPPSPPAPSSPSPAPAESSAPTEARVDSPILAAHPSAAPATARRRDVDSAAVSAALQQYRDAIARLIGTIVNNRLNNYTAFTPVQNVMRAQHVNDGGTMAFLAAVEAELGRLTGENCASFGADLPHLASWQEVWRPELGIVDPVA